MPDPTVPQILADYIKDLQRRVRALENTQRLVASAIQGGRIRVLQDDETPVAAFGELDSGLLGTEFYDDIGDVVARFGQLDAGARDGLEMFAGSTRIIRADDRGSLDPVLYIPAVPSINSFSVTIPNSGATYTLAYSFRIVRLQHKYMRLSVSVTTGTSTSGFMRVATSSGQVSVDRTLPTGGGLTATLFLELTAALGTPDLSVYLEVRNPSGPNNITVGTPDVALGDFTTFATTSGTWF